MLFPELLTPEEIKATFGLHITRGDLMEPTRSDPKGPNRIFMRDIVRAVSEETEIPVKDIMGRNRRDNRAIRARQIAMWVSYQVTGHGYHRIGYFFDRDHSTVVHARKRIDQLRDRYINVHVLTDRIRAEFSQ